MREVYLYILNKLRSITNKVGDFFTGIYNIVNKETNDIIQHINNAFVDFGNSIYTNLKKIYKNVKDFADDSKTFFTNIGVSFANDSVKIYNTIKKALKSAIDVITRFVTGRKKSNNEKHSQSRVLLYVGIALLVLAGLLFMSFSTSN